MKEKKSFQKACYRRINVILFGLSPYDHLYCFQSIFITSQIQKCESQVSCSQARQAQILSVLSIASFHTQPISFLSIKPFVQ